MHREKIRTLEEKKNQHFFILFWSSCKKPRLLSGTAAALGDLELDLLFLDCIISDFEIKIRDL